MNNINAPLIVGFDLGTTAIKGALYDLSGNCVGLSKRNYSKVVTPKLGWVEQDPSEWMDAISDICAELTRDIDASRISAFGLVSQVNTHVFVDKDLQPLSFAISWQDQRCAEAALELDSMISDELREKTWGKEFSADSSFLMSRAHWMRKENPEMYERTAYILSPKDYCIARLSKNVVSDPISSIGLVDESGAYHTEAIDLVDGLSERLPPIKNFTEVAGHIESDTLGFSCPIAVSTMDAWGSVFGSNALNHGDCFQVAGTSEIVGIMSDTNQAEPGIVTFPKTFGRYLHAGPTQMGGRMAEWFADFIGVPIDEVFARAEKSMASGFRNPLVFLPHFQGERAPFWDAQAKGAITGMNADHTLDDLCRGVLEGVAIAASLIIDGAEKAAGLSPEEVILSGGASKSDLWNQIKSSVSEKPYSRLSNTDSGVLGAVVLAGVASGLFEDIGNAADSMVLIDKTYQPDDSKIEYYRDLKARYLSTYAALQPINQELFDWNQALRAN